MTRARKVQTAPPDLGQDLSVCDREPIHVPGSIQPHGLLLVIDPATLEIVAGAGDIEGRLAGRWLGLSLGEVLGPAAAATLKGAPDSPTVVLGRIGHGAEPFDAVARRLSRVVAIELEPASDPAPSAVEVLSSLDAASMTFERASDLRDLCRRAAIAFRQVTGFDRVMVYRFLDDDAGVVEAEDAATGLGSFLHHHFPASDIPKQARVLYVRNRVRVIPDVGYGPAPIRSGAGDFEELDLSDVDLRSVSPIHLQYLKNMGVAASASVSIVKDGVLWGLIACHHAEPRQLGFATRMTCRALAGGLARQIRAREDAEIFRERLRLRSAEDAVVSHLRADTAFETLFAKAGEDLRRMLDAEGFAALQGPDLYATGHRPERADIGEIGGWVRARAVAQPFSTDALSTLLPSARAFEDSASGLLAVTISTEVPIILMWFRAEHIEHVNWAGNPHKAVAVDRDAILTPRASFEAWSQTVRGHATPWTLATIEAAGRLRRLIFEARQNHQIRELNRQLNVTVQDKDHLITQKDDLLKEVNHRVQNSLQLVGAFLSLQARATRDETLSGHLAEAQRRLAAVALVHRRLYDDDRVETMDLGRYIEDLAAEIRRSMGSDWATEVSLDLSPILISTDRAVNVGLILTELLINAQKYAYAGAPGPVSVSLAQHRNRFRLIVADQGSGRTGSREGFGTRMLNAMVERLSGEIEEGDNQPGLRIILTAPIAAS